MSTQREPARHLDLGTRADWTGMKLRTILGLPVVLALSTVLAWAGQDPAIAGDAGCWQIARQLPHTASQFGHGLITAPRNAIRPSNLKWELPIAAATGLLIATSDNHINNHIQSPTFVRDSARGSNIGLGIELGAAGLMYMGGCSGNRSSYAASAGFTALEAMGAANLMTFGIKAAANRQYAYHSNSQGEFWEGGRSFPSGHAASSFAFASVVAHRYPHNFWIKWGAYGLATGVSLARVGGKKHFASDILVGGTIGYVTGTYLATH
jgi:membrane-associated phospholipid phosphatase